MLKSLLTNKYFRLKKSILIKKLTRKIIDSFVNKLSKKKDFQKLTYLTSKNTSDWNLHKFFSFSDSAHLEHFEYLFKKSDDILKHKFELLGFGTFDVNIKENETLTEKITNQENFVYSQNLRKLLPKDYKKIDWHCDFNSNYRWSINSWYKDIKHCVKKGVDIKIPWELARMQHLPVLALSHLYAKAKRELYQNEYYNEYKNQIIDFVSANPPRFGLHWNCTMEVAIRAINLLLSYDIISNDEIIASDDTFKSIFLQTILEHYHHIANNLEWSSGMRGNHYLTNIVCLLICSAYLPLNNDVREILAYSIQELIQETLYQFNSDGTNFEASTGYHLLSAELVFLAYLYLCKLPQNKIESLKLCKARKFRASRSLKSYKKQIFSISLNPPQIIFPESFIERLKNIAKFCLEIIDGNQILYIGDYDSGRVLDLIYNREKLNAIYLLNIIFNLENRPEAQNLFLTELYQKLFNHPTKHDLKINKTNTQWLCSPFANFGLYVYRNATLYITIRCGDIGQKGKGGHSHNDQLSITLNIAGKPFIVEPGTFCYTYDLELRNLFRSTKYHNTLFVKDIEQNDIEAKNCEDLFWIAKHKTKAKCIIAENTIFIGKHSGFGKAFTRSIKFSQDCILIEDNIEIMEEKGICFHLHPEIQADIREDRTIIYDNNHKIELKFENYSKVALEDYFYSDEYGSKKDAKKIVVYFKNEKLITQIKVL